MRLLKGCGMRVLAIEGSPRERGNSSILLDWVIERILDAGGEVTRCCVRDLSIEPCRGCGGCRERGECIIKDDMAWVIEALKTSDHLVVSTPVYFYHVPAQLKALIDRLQPLWVKRSLLGSPWRRSRGYLLLLAVGATKGDRLFEGIILTMNCIASVLGFTMMDPILVRGVDAQGAIGKLAYVRQMVQKNVSCLADV